MLLAFPVGVLVMGIATRFRPTGQVDVACSAIDVRLDLAHQLVSDLGPAGKAWIPKQPVSRVAARPAGQHLLAS
jgi:hypothetical protein